MIISDRWELSKEFSFEAAHQLPLHDGKCSRLHGHSFKGRVVVWGGYLQEAGPKTGMLVDYADMSTAIKHMVDNYLDHYYLNEVLHITNPTSELLAQWIYHYLATKPVFATFAACCRMAVEIEETCTSRCIYAQMQRK